jgi:hypothetical protein
MLAKKGSTMSLPPADQPLADDEEDRRRKAEIEEMMRSQRESYFRDEPVQQEYRDILTRQEQQQADAGTVKPVRTPGPFDEALARFKERRAAAVEANPADQADASGLSPLFDGGEGEARSIFRRNDEIPDNVPEALPDAGVGKSDRLPASRSELPPPSSMFDPKRYGAGVASRRRDDPVRVFEVDTPLRFDGENRVEELQGNNPERPLPIMRSLKDQINYAGQKNGVGVEVHSGGQVAKGEVGPRTKSDTTRHDHGAAADVDLYVIEGGKRRYLDSKNPEDREKMKSFIRDIVIAGATGIGHGYMNTGDGFTRRIHVGGGEPAAAWRDQYARKDPRHQDPFAWVEEARFQGANVRNKMFKSGAWPNPTAPLKFMP